MKEHEQKEFERMKKLADEMEKSPLTKKLRAEEARAILSKRSAAADKIKDLKLDLEATRIIQKDVDELNLKLAALDAEREKIKEAIAGKQYFMMSEKGGIEADIRQSEEILLRTYDTAIDDAISFFRDKLDYLRSPGRISNSKTGGERNIFTETVMLKEESNYPAIIKAINYCRACIDELEKMKLTPEFDMGKIEALKKGIPDINIFTENTNVKPLPGSKGVNPLHLFKSDSEMDWTIGKLMKKAEKILRR